MYAGDASVCHITFDTCLCLLQVIRRRRAWYASRTGPRMVRRVVTAARVGRLRLRPSSSWSDDSSSCSSTSRRRSWRRLWRLTRRRSRRRSWRQFIVFVNESATLGLVGALTSYVGDTLPLPYSRRAVDTVLAHACDRCSTYSDK